MEARIGEAVLPDVTDAPPRLKMWGANGFRYETANWERELRALNRKAKRGHIKLTDNGAVFERPRVFINSLSDTFEDFTGDVYRLEDGKPVVVSQSLDDVRARFFRVAEECTELDLLLVTKRPEKVLGMVPPRWIASRVAAEHDASLGWPSHVWLGTTVEDQEHADKRIPELLKAPARVRFLSVEPLLGNVDLGRAFATYDRNGEPNGRRCNADGSDAISWVIVGGESGTNARPMHPDWVRRIRDQCVSAGVPFFMKQWGEWVSILDRDNDDPDWRYDYAITKRDQEHYRTINLAGGQGFHGDRLHVMRKVGKKAAGRILDGRTWDEVPK
jgi:protein gp37